MIDRDEIGEQFFDVMRDFDRYPDDFLLPEPPAARITGYAYGTFKNRRLSNRPIVPYVRLPGGAIRYRVGTLRAAIRNEACASK